MRKIAVILALALIAFSGFAQDTTAAAPNALGFMAGLNLGTDVIVNQQTGKKVNWTKFAFTPDVAFGKFGVGLDLTMHLQFYATQDTPVTIYAGDWKPDFESNGKTFLDVYLPKLMYVRYGVKGEDSLFAKVGSISNLTLGNGFIMGEYSNMSFLPTTRILGLDFGLDAAMFKFPYVGLQLAVGNMAQFDVIGGRLYTRPFIGTSIPILKNAEIGATVVSDNHPDIYGTTTSVARALTVYGMDFSAPVISSKAFPLLAFADIAFEPNKSFGAMAGVGGKLLGFVTYGAQLRLLQDNFVPAYFDSNYDLYRALKYDFMQTTVGGSVYGAWYSSLGFTVLKDKIVFNAKIDGPFQAIDATSTNQADYPHVKVIATLAEGFLGGFSVDASYEKYYLGKVGGFFKDLIDPLDAIIGMTINYHTGASILTLKYNARYDPTVQSATFEDKFVVTSSITATMKF